MTRVLVTHWLGQTCCPRRQPSAEAPWLQTAAHDREICLPDFCLAFECCLYLYSKALKYKIPFLWMCAETQTFQEMCQCQWHFPKEKSLFGGEAPHQSNRLTQERHLSRYSPGKSDNDKQEGCKWYSHTWYTISLLPSSLSLISCKLLHCI